ncbi:MAG: hypothetical protein U0670_03520 [Anaerolineae bacterium]
MREDTQRVSPIHRYLMLAHTALYAAMWLLSFIAAASQSSASSGLTGGHVLVVLVWTLLYVVHVANFMAMNGRSHSSAGDRQSYRDGYRDAMREVMALQAEGRSGNRRLDQIMLEEDGELFEPLQSEKAKRRETR